MPLSPGTRLGPYEILTPVGAGGMGEVYKARDTRLDRTIAIKVLPPQTAERPEVRQRFEREARAVSALSPFQTCAPGGLFTRCADRKPMKQQTVWLLTDALGPGNF
jgi:serine/threonine protein kinase